MAQIQIWTRDVNGTAPFGDLAPQHTFFIKINDNGTREIIRGGPINDNMVTDDIKVVKQEYNDIKQSDNITQTYDYFDPAKSNTSNYQGTTVKTASQSEIDSLWNKAWTKAQTINSQSYDYEPLTQNCNTTTYIMASEMGLVPQVKSFLDQKQVWTPGFGNDFEHSLPDKGWDFLEEFPTNFKNDLNTIKDWLDDFSDSREFEDDNTTLKTSFNDKYSFEIKEGNKSIQLANSGMIATDAVYVDANGNPVSEYSALFKVEDDSGNIFTLVRDNVYMPLKDGTMVAVNAVINVIDSATSSLISFINHQIEGIFEPIFKELFSTDDSTKNANGDNAAQRLAGKILADLIQGKDITDIAQDQVNSVLIQNLLKDASAKLASVIPTGPLGADTAQFVQGTIAGAIINFAIAVAADRRMDSDEYGEAAAKALTSAALYKHFGGGAQGVAAVAAVMSLYDSFKADHSMNSDQYEDAATSAAANDNFPFYLNSQIKREAGL